MRQSLDNRCIGILQTRVLPNEADGNFTQQSIIPARNKLLLVKYATAQHKKKLCTTVANIKLWLHVELLHAIILAPVDHRVLK